MTPWVKPKAGDLPNFDMGDAATGVSEETAAALQVSLVEFNTALNTLDGELDNAAKQADLMGQAVALFSQVVGFIGERVTAQVGGAEKAGPDLNKRLTRSIAAVAKQDSQYRNFGELARVFFRSG